MSLHPDDFRMFETTFGVAVDKFIKTLRVKGRFSWDTFDIVAFDAFVKCPNGTSLKDFLQKKHGIEVAEIVRKLIVADDLRLRPTSHLKEK